MQEQEPKTHNYNLPRPYLSASSIATLMRCPKQFEFRYVEGLVSPPAIAALTGSAVHAGLEYYYEDVLTGVPERLPASVVADYAVTSLEEKAADQGLPLAGADKDEAVFNVKTASESYIKYVGEGITPITVEQEINYISECGVPIKGFIDLIRAPTQEEIEFNNTLDEGSKITKVINDYKITGKKWTAAKLINSLQFHLYSMATGIHHVEIKNIVKTEKKVKVLPKKGVYGDTPAEDITSNIRLIRHTFHDSDFPHVERIVRAAAELITTGLFMPCDMDSWCCNPQWCGYWHLCRGA